MVCPSCGTLAEGPGRFCAKCGARLPEPESATPAGGFAAPPPPPPPAAWSQPPTAPQPQAAQPAWSQPPTTPPMPTAPPAPSYVAQPQFQAPTYAPPAYPQAPGYAQAPTYAQTPAYAQAAAGRNPALLGGVVALIGGAVAVASAWLPWAATPGGDSLYRPVEMTGSMTDIANGYYLIAAGVIAAVAGALLLAGLARTANLRSILAVAVVLAGIAVLAVEFGAYGHVNQMITDNVGGAGFVKMGIALWVGAAGGVAAIAGGVLGLVLKR